jgi:hypothetical protein
MAKLLLWWWLETSRDASLAMFRHANNYFLYQQCPSKAALAAASSLS